MLYSPPLSLPYFDEKIAWLGYKMQRNLGYFIFLVSFLGVLSIDIHLPAIPLIIKELHADKIQAQCIFLYPFLISVFARLLVGPMIPKVGRKRFLLVAYAIALFAQASCALAPTIDWLLVLRVPAGVSGAMLGVSIALLVAEFFEGEYRARMQGLMELAYSAAITIAPVFGAFISESFGWRGCFGFVFFAFLINALLILNTFPDVPGVLHQQDSPLTLKSSFRDYKVLFLNPKSLILLVTPGLLVGTHLIFSINSPFFYIMQFGVSPKMFAFYQSTPILVNIVFLSIYRYAITQIGFDRAISIGVSGYAVFLMYLAAILLGFIPANPKFLLIMMCIQCASTSFLISSFSAKLFDCVPHSKNSIASLVSTVRPLCISICLTIATFFGSKNLEEVLLVCFFASGLFAFALALLSRQIVAKASA